MSKIDEVRSAMVQAMKNKDKERKDSLSMLLAALKNKAIDTLNFVRWAYPLLGKYNLQLMAKLMDIKVNEAHRAYDDARVCMEVFNKTLSDTKSIQITK